MKPKFNLLISTITLLGFIIISASCKKDDDPQIPKVKTVSVSDLTISAVIANGQIESDGGAQITEKGFCIGLNEEPTITETKLINLDETNNFSFQINELEPATKYYIRAYAINNVGIAYGNEISFTTLTPNEPNLITVNASSVKLTKAKIYCEIADNGELAITERGICYGTQNNPTIENSTLTSSETTSNYTCSISGLSASTTYYARAYVVTDFSIYYGNNIEFSTEDATVNDVDLNVYNVIEIGNQLWLKQNLKTTKYSNGDLIETTTLTNIDVEEEPKYQWPAMIDESYVETYGRLYTWYAAVDSRGLCPTGWHLPSDSEWDELTNFLGGENVAGGKLKSIENWNTPNNGATDEVGFSSVGSGYRIFTGDPTYIAFGVNGLMWSSDEGNQYYGKNRVTVNTQLQVYNSSSHKKSALTVRCIKDEN